MTKDIENRDDLKTLFTDFYELAMKDEEIGYFFTEVIPIDLEEHLPHILDFWEANLWAKISYKKNLIKVHENIHEKSKMEASHFDRWLHLLNTCVDAKFEGPFAERLKTNALSIGTVMKIKVL